MKIVKLIKNVGVDRIGNRESVCPACRNSALLIGGSIYQIGPNSSPPRCEPSSKNTPILRKKQIVARQAARNVERHHFRFTPRLSDIDMMANCQGIVKNLLADGWRIVRDLP